MTRIQRRNLTRQVKLLKHRGMIYKRGCFWRKLQWGDARASTFGMPIEGMKQLIQDLETRYPYSLCVSIEKS